MILENAQSPKNEGHIRNANLKASISNPLCGDQISIEISSRGDLVKDIKFSGTGCIIMKASASLVTEKVKAIKEIKKIKKLNELDIYNLMGGELTTSRQKCASLVLEAIKKALKD
jgi:nitrogen fixation NifU-like protein